MTHEERARRWGREHVPQWGERWTESLAAQFAEVVGEEALKWAATIAPFRNRIALLEAALEIPCKQPDQCDSACKCCQLRFHARAKVKSDLPSWCGNPAHSHEPHINNGDCAKVKP